MTLSERMKLSKNVRKLQPAAYTMSGAPPAGLLLWSQNWHMDFGA